MISSADRLVRRGRALGVAVALVALRHAVGTSWGVDPEQVRIELGPGIAAPAEDATLRLAGAPGADGRFIAVAEEAGGVRAFPVRAGLLGPVPVATRALPAGRTLDAGDVRVEERVTWGAPAAPRAGAPGPGWTTRRPLAAGDVIAPPSVVAPRLVAAGEPVTVVWQRGTVRLSFAATALAAAGEGEPLAVRAAGRARRLEAIAIAPGTVALAGGER